MSLTVPGLTDLSRELANDASRGIDAEQSREFRRAKGAFFTPQALVRFVVKTALSERLARGEVEWHPAGYPLLRVLDPSAGDGRFLVEAGRALAAFGRDLGLEVDEREIRRHCLVGIERDPAFAEIAAKALGGEAEIYCAEALLSGTVPESSVDLVIGNPPYLRSIALGRVDAELRSKLRGTFAATSHGEWDLYAAFLEQGLRWLRGPGVLGMVVPSRWWSARWAGPLRELLGVAGAPIALVDFGDTQIFSDATVYASVCVAGTSSCSSVAVARLDRGSWLVGRVARETLAGAQPWDLAVGKDREFVAWIRANGQALGSFARIAKGTGTNADSVFVVDSELDGIEGEVLHSVLRGRDIVALGSVPSWPKLLVPYDAEGALYRPEQLEARYPNAYAYLLAHREVLESREQGRFAGDRFYCFGRPQNLTFLRSQRPKVVVPDVTRTGRALVDESGAMVLDSAYAIRLGADAPIDHDSLCGILCSTVVERWFRSQGVPLRGGYTRMKTAYLSELPMPQAREKVGAIGDLVRRGASLEEIDDQTRRAYGASHTQWSHGR